MRTKSAEIVRKSELKNVRGGVDISLSRSLEKHFLNMITGLIKHYRYSTCLGAIRKNVAAPTNIRGDVDNNMIQIPQNESNIMIDGFDKCQT